MGMGGCGREDVGSLHLVRQVRQVDLTNNGDVKNKNSTTRALGSAFRDGSVPTSMITAVFPWSLLLPLRPRSLLLSCVSVSCVCGVCARS